MAKMAVSELLHSPKLIPCRIQVTEKTWTFHTVPIALGYYNRVIISDHEMYLVKKV